jgi:hypothetical protein
VLRALKKKKEDKEAINWKVPFANDPAVRLLERNFSEACARMCLVQNTYLSIDDDQYRLQSAESEEMGLVRVHNPRKAFGPVSTNIVSLASGIVMGMRLLGRGENYQTVVKILLRWIHFKDCDLQVKGKNTVCLDRGYLNEGLIQHFMDCGFDIIGTHKQGLSFPFSFGKVATSNGRKFIEKDGAKALYAAKMKIGDRELYGLAYRSGRGNVAACISSNPRLPMWIFRSKRQSQWEPNYDEHPLITTTLQATTTPLTAFQGGCEWHVLRIGRITSTVGYKALRYSFSLFNEMEKCFLSDIGVKEKARPLYYTLEYLNSQCVKDLRLILQKQNDNIQGTKVIVWFTI